MNDENISFLLQRLSTLGFSENVISRDQLDQGSETTPKEFHLYIIVPVEGCILETILYFRLSDYEETYFFNRYDSWLATEPDPAGERKQTFRITGGKGVTVKEAFNLLQGRAVYKEMKGREGEKYRAWIKLNFEQKDEQDGYKVKQYRDQYQYELDKVLAKYPILELTEKLSKQRLVNDLQEGNRCTVTFKKPRRTEKMYIEANPATMTINIFPVKN